MGARSRHPPKRDDIPMGAAASRPRVNLPGPGLYQLARRRCTWRACLLLSALNANSPPVSGCIVNGIAHVWPAMMIASWSWVPASLVVTAASAAASAVGRLMRTSQLAGCWTGWLRAGCSATATPAEVNVTGLPSVRKQTPVGGLGGLTGPAPPGAPLIAPGPESATEPAGHLLTDAPGSLSPGCRTMSDARRLGTGSGAGAGPSGSAWLQPATVSARPARA